MSNPRIRKSGYFVQVTCYQIVSDTEQTLNLAKFLLPSDCMSRRGKLLNVSARLLDQGYSVRFSAPGTSMGPTIRDGEPITVAPAEPSEITLGDIVAYRNGHGLVAHRVVRIERRDQAGGGFVLRGDSATTCDAPVAPEQILGKVISVERRGRQLKVSSRPAKLAYAARVVASRASRSIDGRAALVSMLVMAWLRG